MSPLPALRRWAARLPQAWQMAVMVAALYLLMAVFLWSLPILATVVGAILPIASISWLVLWVLRRRRS